MSGLTKSLYKSIYNKYKMDKISVSVSYMQHGDMFYDSNGGNIPRVLGHHVRFGERTIGGAPGVSC